MGEQILLLQLTYPVYGTCSPLLFYKLAVTLNIPERYQLIKGRASGQLSNGSADDKIAEGVIHRPHER